MFVAFTMIFIIQFVLVHVGAVYTYYKSLCQEISLKRRGKANDHKKQRRRERITWLCECFVLHLFPPTQLFLYCFYLYIISSSFLCFIEAAGKKSSCSEGNIYSQGWRKVGEDSYLPWTLCPVKSF